jgi:hypothetical protein
VAASVRVEDEAFSDERYADLAGYTGLADADHARGKMERLWRQCTQEARYSLPVETITRHLGPNGVDAIVRARLGEVLADGSVRIRGTRGRIEWLKKLRANGKFGKRGGRPKRNPHGFGEGYENKTPPAPAPAPAPAQDPEPEKPPLPPRGGTGRVRGSKSKPADPTPAERDAAKRVLERVGARTGVEYRGSDPHVRLITRHLRAGLTERELRGVAAYCWEPSGLGWELKPEMHGYFRPETLFGPEKIHSYLPAARAYLAKHYPEQPAPETGAPAAIAADLFARHQEAS